MSPPGQAINDGGADPSDLKRYRAAPLSEAARSVSPVGQNSKSGRSTSAKKKFDRAGSTALSHGKELRVFS
jgi:hypothetical protein